MAATAGREGGGGIVDAVSVWCVCVRVFVRVCGVHTPKPCSSHDKGKKPKVI